MKKKKYSLILEVSEMPRNVVLYVATSLDGYIARINGEVDWLPPGDGGYGFEEFYANVSTVLMGRKTYEEIFRITTKFPYEGKECYVFSRTKHGKDEYVAFVNEPVSNFVSQLRPIDGKNI